MLSLNLIQNKIFWFAVNILYRMLWVLNIKTAFPYEQLMMRPLIPYPIDIRRKLS